MPFSIANKQGRQILKLEGAVTIRHAQDLAAKLAEGLEDGTPVGVDTGGLEDIDTCILQLLCSLRKTGPGSFLRQPVGCFHRRGGPLRPAARVAQRTGGFVKTIMTVDDSASLRQMVSFVLRDGGYEVVEAVDGLDALSKLNGPGTAPLPE